MSCDCNQCEPRGQLPAREAPTVVPMAPEDLAILAAPYPPTDPKRVNRERIQPHLA